MIEGTNEPTLYTGGAERGKGRPAFNQRNDE